MDFPDFPYKGLDGVSFLKSQQVQKYIEQFAEHFGLNKYIRVREKIDKNNFERKTRICILGKILHFFLKHTCIHSFVCGFVLFFTSYHHHLSS